jgi:hypothetical protein
MILVRVVMHAKQGKVNQLVAGMKEMTQNGPNRPRILTDLSGPFNTVVLEGKYESLAAYEKWRTEFFSSLESRPDTPSEEMFESGSNEFYTIEQE